MSVQTQRYLWLLAVSAALSAIGLVAGQAESGVLDASWTAPWTNTHGAPLTDLQSYRVCYGTSPSPCPGGTFVRVASATSSPASAATLTVTLNPASFTFTDDPLSAYRTVVKAVTSRSSEPTSTAGTSRLRVDRPHHHARFHTGEGAHLEELRPSLRPIKPSGGPPRTYTDPAVTPFVLTISAGHVSEVRAPLQAL